VNEKYSEDRVSSQRVDIVVFLNVLEHSKLLQVFCGTTVQEQPTQVSCSYEAVATLSNRHLEDLISTGPGLGQELPLEVKRQTSALL